MVSDRHSAMVKGTEAPEVSWNPTAHSKRQAVASFQQCLSISRVKGLTDFGRAWRKLADLRNFLPAGLFKDKMPEWIWKH
jgi:hypothetical protein